MIVTCSNCFTRLRLDNAKVPAQLFSVRCPNCAQILNVQPPSAEAPGGANATVVDTPSTASTPQEMNSGPAPRFETGNGAAAIAAQPAEPTLGEGEVARLLSALLSRGVPEKTDSRGVMRRPSWDRRRALVCVGSMQCKDVANALDASNYEVHVAEDIPQAIDCMREEKVDVIVLDSEFQLEGQGAALINREINSMRMADRRRTVFVHLSTTLRTGDAHAAFLSNVNLIVNASDVRQFPAVLEKNVRDLNELYRDFNRALNIAEL